MYEVIDILIFGISLILDIADCEMCLTFIEDSLQLLEKLIPKNIDNLKYEESSQSFIPDVDIVNRLCQQGYSLEGARRSSIMTNNRSFHAAMKYAVAHSSNFNFNEPIIFLHKVSDQRYQRLVNQYLFVTIRKILESTHVLLRKNLIHSPLPLFDTTEPFSNNTKQASTVNDFHHYLSGKEPTKCGW